MEMGGRGSRRSTAGRRPLRRCRGSTGASPSQVLAFTNVRRFVDIRQSAFHTRGLRGSAPMSFAELLYELPTDRLKEIVARRADTFRGIPRITDKRELARFLSSALSSARSVSKALRSTSLPEVRTL